MTGPALLLASLVATAGSGIVDSIFLRQATVARELAGVEYVAEFSFVETDLRTNTASSINCLRRVRMRSYETQKHEFLTVRVDGREVLGREKNRVCRDLFHRGFVARNTLMPFLLESRPEYNYSVTGRFRWQSQDVWAVRFEPRRATDRHVRGFAYVLATTYDVVRLEFIPARLPFVVTDARLTLDYGLIQGYWLPQRFELDMDLRLAAIVEVMRRHIHIADSYSSYRLEPNR